MPLKTVNPAAWIGRAGLGDVDQRHADDARADSTSRLRFQRLVERLHDLGPGGLSYFLREVDRGADVLDTLEIYAALPGDLIRAYGADRFPAAVHVVGGGRL
jgi:hypothetical protein